MPKFIRFLNIFLCKLPFSEYLKEPNLWYWDFHLCFKRWWIHRTWYALWKCILFWIFLWHYISKETYQAPKLLLSFLKSYLKLFHSLPSTWTLLKGFIPNSKSMYTSKDEWNLDIFKHIFHTWGLGTAKVQKYLILPYFCDRDAIFDIKLLSEETNGK